MDKLTPFDEITSSQELQILKLIIPYLPPEQMQMFAFYIKFMELSKLIKHFSKSQTILRKQAVDQAQMFEEILPYLPENMSEQMEQAKALIEMMEMMDAMQKGDDNDGTMDESS